jgi:signal transduction histidine kinase
MKDLSLHVLDILQNSLSAEAHGINVEIVEDQVCDKYLITISDDGKGMSTEMVNKVTDPFFTTRTTRKVGLGIPLLKEHAERTGGTFSITSMPGKGTEIAADFILSHVDRQPLGDIAGAIVLTAAANPQVRIRYSHSTGFGTYLFDSFEVSEILGDTPINNARVIKFLVEMINENLEQIKYSH